MSETIQKGDQVRVDIPDEADPDYRYHGEHGEVVEILDDDAGRETGDSLDSQIYRLRLESGETVDLRWRDIRPPLQ
jgi:hypothetical protein